MIKGVITLSRRPTRNNTFYGHGRQAIQKPANGRIATVRPQADCAYKGLGLASIYEARASACVSIYSRIFVTLPFRTVMSKTQLSLNGLFVALIFPVATPTTRTRSPCATNSGGYGYVISTSSDAF